MKAPLLFLAALILAGCSSHKTAASASTVDAETSVDMQVSSHSRQSADLWAMLRAVCDSLRLNIRADLVVMTPEGTAIVNPAIGADISQPLIEAEGSAHTETASSVETNIHQDSHLQARDNTEEESDSTTIAKPMALPDKLIILVIAITLTIVLWHWNKNRK